MYMLVASCGPPNVCMLAAGHSAQFVYYQLRVPSSGTKSTKRFSYFRFVLLFVWNLESRRGNDIDKISEERILIKYLFICAAKGDPIKFGVLLGKEQRKKKKKFFLFFFRCCSFIRNNEGLRLQTAQCSVLLNPGKLRRALCCPQRLYPQFPGRCSLRSRCR